MYILDRAFLFLVFELSKIQPGRLIQERYYPSKVSTRLYICLSVRYLLHTLWYQ